jgi:VWFA-related protein
MMPPSVRVLFSVINKDKKFVDTLSKDDIRILEDGVPQEITSLERQTDIPLSLSFLIDMSISQERVIPTTRKVAFTFVNSILRQGKDAAAVATFMDKVSVAQPLTTNLQEVLSAIERLEFVPPPSLNIGKDTNKPSPSLSKDQMAIGSTAIWDAVWFTCENILPPGAPTRRALILITDGADTNSQKKRDEAIERAVKDDLIVYAIGIADEYYGGVNEGPLRKVAERTGGRAFFPKKVKDLYFAFVEIEQELRSQYVVTYSPLNKMIDGLYRKVRIEIINPEKKKDKLNLTYRPGYYVGGR